MDHQLLSGSPVSSSHKLSSQDRCRTMPESTQSPLISFRSSTRCMTKFSQMKLPKSQKMVASASVCTWKERDGTQLAIILMTPSQNNSTLTSHLSGSYRRRIASHQKLASTDAPSTKPCLEQVPCQPQDILPISASGSSFQAEK